MHSFMVALRRREGVDKRRGGRKENREGGPGEMLKREAGDGKCRAPVSRE
jgi:hypothetical protein